VSGHAVNDTKLARTADTAATRRINSDPRLNQCERAFDRFWRADSTTEGSGLGLAIVKNLVELSGGTVALERASKDGGVIARATFPAV